MKQKMQYLVIARRPVDDVPMGLFDDPGEAHKAARRMCPQTINRIAKDIGFLEDSPPLSVDILPFMDGLPGRSETVRIFDEGD